MSNSNNPIDTLQSVKVTLNGQEVTGFLRRLSVSQSIEQPLMTSIIQFTDARYQSQQAPAGSKIEINVTPNNGRTLKVEHIVEKLDKTSMAVTGKFLVGDIRGVSPEYKDFVTKRITKSYEGQPPEKIIESVLKEAGSKKKLTSGSYKTVPAQFLANRNTTVEVIDKAKKHPGKGSALFFWEDVQGFNLKSVDELVKQSVVAQLIYDHAAYTKAERSMTSPNNIFDMEFEFGSYGDTLKGDQGQDTLVAPSGNQFKQGDKAPSTNEGTKSRLMSGLNQTQFNNYVRDTTEQYKAKRGQDFSKQEQSLAQLTARATFLVTLRPDITAGSVIQLKTGGGTGFSDSNPEMSHNGKWLVQKITHVCDFTDGSATPYGRSIIECIGKIK
jgi:hypothetical protein